MRALLPLIFAALLAQVISYSRNSIPSNSRPNHNSDKNYSWGNCQKKCGCGIRRTDKVGPLIRSGREERIFGGSQAHNDSHPWLVRLFVNHYPNTICGGTLLNHNFVLTAAHCVHELDKGSVLIAVLGDYDQSDIDDDSGEVARKIAKIHIHKKYIKSQRNHDIALLELAEPVRYSWNIRPACIPSYEGDPPASHGWAVGWGQISHKNETHLPDTPLEVELPLISREQCRIRFKYFGANNKNTENAITRNMLCAGKLGKDTCKGDSGGPLLVKRCSRYEVHGIVSWGPTECGRFHAGVYVKVFNYLNWMKEIMNCPCINCL